MANKNDNRCKTWFYVVGERERERESSCGEIKTFEEYAKYFEAEKTNHKEQVVRSTYRLNELLHKHGIPEKIRSQFVGSVLLALKNGLKDNYKNAVGQFWKLHRFWMQSRIK